MRNINIFCFGFGQVAKNFIKKLNVENYNIRLATTSRSKSSKKIFNGINYNNYLFNGEGFDKNLVKEHYDETNSEFSKKIIDNFDKEISNFIQVCPKEMIDKLKNPISLKPIIKEVS